jgi:hypothetical protein
MHPLSHTKRLRGAEKWASVSPCLWSWLPNVLIALALVIVLMIVVTSGDIEHGMTGAVGSGRYCSPRHRMPYNLRCEGANA